MAVAFLVIVAVGCGDGADTATVRAGAPSEAAAPVAGPPDQVKPGPEWVEEMFATRYGASRDQLWSVNLDAKSAATLLGPDMIANQRSVRLVYAVGAYTDTMAHPPYGYEMPTGKTAYLVLGEDGSVLGGGLFNDDRSGDISRGRAPERFAQSSTG